MISKIKLGMPYAKLLKRKKDLKTVPNEVFGFRKVLSEKIEDQAYSELIYYVDEDGEKPFYELIVIYPDDVNVRNVATELYGPPNKDKEWWFEHPKGPAVNIWVFKQKIVIAGIISGTEWNEIDN